MSTTKADYELRAWLDDDRIESVVFNIRKPNPDDYIMAKSYIDQGKEFEGVYLLVKALLISGDDPIVLRTNLTAYKSVEALIMKLFKPVEGELKKI
jgi:hypothetical protein